MVYRTLATVHSAAHRGVKTAGALQKRAFELTSPKRGIGGLGT